ncbi:MAG: hypothetical protein R3240_00595 [Gammaproteobacteria bacterium]|nr:hypothetical protein [Gammaproteobacteria bacterium]
MTWIKKLLHLLAKPLSQKHKTWIWNLFIRIRYRIHTWLGEHENLLFSIYSWLNIYSEYAVSKDTDIVIDAFPRSGSTFSVYAFYLAQEQNAFKIAYHLHVPAHITRAIKLNKPALVIIRDPKSAVSSAVVRDSPLLIKEYLLRYRSFYLHLEPFLDQFVLASFDQATNDLGLVIQKINQKYGTNFKEFEYTKENLVQIKYELQQRQQQLGGNAHQSYLPNQAKQNAKQTVSFSKHESLLNQCEEIYQRYLDYLEKSK